MAGPFYDPSKPGRPPCYGQLYDSESRECRSCPYQGSCRDEVIRLRSRSPAPSVPTAPYVPYTNQSYTTFQRPASSSPTYQRPAYGSPSVPVVQVPHQPIVTQYRPQTSAPPPPVQPMPYGYGSIPDPYFPVISAAGSPFRPQFTGESFGERVVKNALLAAMEALVTQIWIAIRQVMWLPVTQGPNDGK